MEQRFGKVRYFSDLEVEIHDGDGITETIFRHSVWEEALSDRLVDVASREGGLLVDVGANIGYFSLLWARARSTNEVFAFEPSPRIFPKLIENVTRNRLDNQIRCFGLALGDAIRIATFRLGPAEQTGWGGITNDESSFDTKVVVNRLDDLVAHRSIRLLKIDVEGADYLVLRGAERLLRLGCIQEIFYEENFGRLRPLGLERGQAKDFLETFSYHVELVADWGDYSDWHATRM